jgi:hypothetical protein
MPQWTLWLCNSLPLELDTLCHFCVPSDDWTHLQQRVSFGLEVPQGQDTGFSVAFSRTQGTLGTDKHGTLINEWGIFWGFPNSVAYNPVLLCSVNTSFFFIQNTAPVFIKRLMLGPKNDQYGLDPWGQEVVTPSFTLEVPCSWRWRGPITLKLTKQGFILSKVFQDSPCSLSLSYLFI